MRPLAKTWRSQGFRIVSYLDDGIFGSQYKQETLLMIATVTTDLTSAGLTLNREKSKLFPTQQDVWLGGGGGGGSLSRQKVTLWPCRPKKLKIYSLVRCVLTRHTSSAT